jgi:hypothetical protein
MDEKDRQKTVDVVDTSDQPAEGGKMVEESVEENRARTNPQAGELAPLFDRDATEKFRSHWLAIQSKFVDDPNDSVKQADQLVSEIIDNMTKSFANRRGTLEKQWNGGEKASTEDLRIALQHYRSFFERLLSLES